MNPNRFLADFYQTDAVLLAPLLLGQLLCRNHEGHITKLPITNRFRKEPRLLAGLFL
ncbi:MAG: hypothetical protein RR051_04750 [Clostridiales bacterium]